MKSPPLSERPPGFTYRRALRGFRPVAKELFADDVSIHALAKRYGTPLYIYSRSTIEERYHQFERAFQDSEHTVCYSVKANSNLSLLKILEKLGAGFDVVSGGELQRVLTANRKTTAKVVFSGVGKQSDEIDLALHSGILLFNVESASELQLLSARATHLRKRARFAVRINPDVEAGTHPHISTGLHEHKFGVPTAEAGELYELGSRNKFLSAAGVSVHIGSQITDLGPFRESMERAAEFAAALRARQYAIRYIDAGGGLGISYTREEGRDFPQHVSAYAEAVCGPVRRLGIHLLLEPGRSIVGPAGILVTRVVYKKRSNGKLFVVTDAAMNDLVRPALYDSYHEIVPVTVGSRGGARVEVDVVGPICESADFFARSRELPDVEQGDLLAILDAGAYGMSLASNYNSRPRAAEVMVEGKSARLIRRRETLADLLAPERV